MKAVFFDAAGTLIRVREPVGETYARIAARHELSVEPAAMEQAFRAAWRRLPQPQHDGGPAADDERGWWRNLVRAVFAPVLSSEQGDEWNEERFENLFGDLYAHFALPEAWLVFPDVRPALESLAGRGRRLLVLSNFDRRLRTILSGHDLTRYFDHLVISSEVGASKPDPLIFATAARLAACSPGECLHIGDDEQCDLQGARAAGFQARLVKRPSHDLLQLVRELETTALL